MTVKYGPWVAFNPGDTPPADDVVVQVQGYYGNRDGAEESDLQPSSMCIWENIIAYRVLQPLTRGEVIYDGTLRTFYSLHAGLTAKCYDKEADHVHVTFTTEDGLLIPGTYSGPDGATIKIEVVK